MHHTPHIGPHADATVCQQVSFKATISSVQDAGRTRGSRTRAGGYGATAPASVEEPLDDGNVLGTYGVADDVDAASEIVAEEVNTAVSA